MRWSAIVAGLLVSASANAAPRRVALLTDTIGSDLSGEAITGEVQGRLGDFLDLELSSALATNPRYLALVDEVRRCGSDSGCVRDRVTESGFDFLLRVLVNTSVAPSMVSLQMIGPGAPDPFFEMVDDASKVASTTSSAALGLFGSMGFARGGRLEVAVTPSDAGITVKSKSDASFEPRVGTNFLLPSGDYLVLAERAGYEPRSELVQVAAPGAQQVQLTLEAIQPWYKSPWVWVGAGVVVAGAVAAIFVATAPESTYSLCQTNDPSRCD